jgi:alpha-beta hydrolase superfamily lysophospholipase
MKSVLSVLCGVLVLAAARSLSASFLGFLVLGPGLLLLLDRYLLRILPWPRPLSWRRELLLRAGWFVFGAAGFFFLRFGVVPWWEASYRGSIVTLSAFLVAGLLELATGGRAGLRCHLGSFAALGVLIPYLTALHPLHTVPRRTPAALGLAFEDVRFRTMDGVRLAGWLMAHPQARGNVVFCHGHGRNRGHGAGLFGLLHEMGFNVLAFDFRGHGDSDGHTSTFGQREVQDVRAAVAYLQGRCPDRPLYLLGVSLGAAVSLQALPHLGGVQGVWAEGCFARLDAEVESYFGWLPAPLRAPLVCGLGWLGWLDAGLHLADVNPIEGVRGTSVPVCFVHGRRDALVPFDHARMLYAACAGPRCCWWVEGGNHYNLRSRHRAEYLQRLRAFLSDPVAVSADRQ